MDWARAIERNSEALKGIVAALFAMLGLAGTDMVARIPLSVHRAVLRLLRPSESAVRRLIVIAARGVVVKLSPSRPMAEGKKIGKGGGSRPPSFQLFDPRKRLPALRLRHGRPTRTNPRIHFFRSDGEVTVWQAHPPAVVPSPPPDGLVNAERLTRRLQALKSALEDLPRQAKRLVRWGMRRKASPGLKFLSPLRPGRPPGYRRKPVHEVDEVLTECDWLAWEAMKPDTS